MLLALAGCGGTAKPAFHSVSGETAALNGSPAPLAALYAQANQLLSGSTGEFAARLAALRGYPIVVNNWASWCGPCQFEFPAFQRASVTYGKRVAFIGIDGKDSNGSASTFLKKFPVPYPSFADPDGRIIASLQTIVAYPQTIYLDRRGKLRFDHAGSYASAAALEQDIRRYALG